MGMEVGGDSCTHWWIHVDVWKIIKKRKKEKHIRLYRNKLKLIIGDL